MLRILARRAASNSHPWTTHSIQIRQFCLGVLPDGIDRTSDSFACNSNAMNNLLSDLQSQITKVLAGGGAEAVKRNSSRNKLQPRERIDRLLDPGSSFLELSQAMNYMKSPCHPLGLLPVLVPCMEDFVCLWLMTLPLREGLIIPSPLRNISGHKRLLLNANCHAYILLTVEVLTCQSRLTSSLTGIILVEFSIIKPSCLLKGFPRLHWCWVPAQLGVPIFLPWLMKA
ncbi:Methylcrotonoyl-CoA carboxylase beta chain, mitochondrial [Morella rubra]|uniref:Methylcrotonoyl-CoA carboxylase beta chain, mitochondrial n=1 Tax=Morella rubra TaxID=262757 RepID=A0A6A1VBI0_9ROSI|nr:Methylcrotonoyl-CoA carboxylase beta chain, mitochondrial [Morella rubra]